MVSFLKSSNFKQLLSKLPVYLQGLQGRIFPLVVLNVDFLTLGRCRLMIAATTPTMKEDTPINNVELYYTCDIKMATVTI